MGGVWVTASGAGRNLDWVAGHILPAGPAPGARAAASPGPGGYAGRLGPQGPPTPVPLGRGAPHERPGRTAETKGPAALSPMPPQLPAWLPVPSLPRAWPSLKAALAFARCPSHRCGEADTWTSVVLLLGEAHDQYARNQREIHKGKAEQISPIRSIQRPQSLHRTQRHGGAVSFYDLIIK